MRSLIGKTDEIELPADSAFEEAAKARFRELDDILVRVETSLDHYRSALRRVIVGTAPNTTKEQYRDSLLWEVVIHLLPDYDVVLITNDADFCESKKYEKGLAKSLIEEYEKLNSVVTLHDSVTSYLRSVREELPPLQYEQIAALISEILLDKHLVEFANSKGFSLGNLKDHSIEAFIIQRRGVLALQFKLSYRVYNVKETQAIIDTDSTLSEFDYSDHESWKKLKPYPIERVLAGYWIFGGSSGYRGLANNFLRRLWEFFKDFAANLGLPSARSLFLVADAYRCAQP